MDSHLNLCLWAPPAVIWEKEVLLGGNSSHPMADFGRRALGSKAEVLFSLLIKRESGWPQQMKISTGLIWRQVRWVPFLRQWSSIPIRQQTWDGSVYTFFLTERKNNKMLLDLWTMSYLNINYNKKLELEKLCSTEKNKYLQLAWHPATSALARGERDPFLSLALSSKLYNVFQVCTKTCIAQVTIFANCVPASCSSQQSSSICWCCWWPPVYTSCPLLLPVWPELQGRGSASALRVPLDAAYSSWLSCTAPVHTENGKMSW